MTIIRQFSWGNDWCLDKNAWQWYLRTLASPASKWNLKLKCLLHPDQWSWFWGLGLSDSKKSVMTCEPLTTWIMNVRIIMTQPVVPAQWAQVCILDLEIYAPCITFLENLFPALTVKMLTDSIHICCHSGCGVCLLAERTSYSNETVSHDCLGADSAFCRHVKWLGNRLSLHEPQLLNFQMPWLLACLSICNADVTWDV